MFHLLAGTATSDHCLGLMLPAGTPAAAESFLKDLADGCRQQADRELSKLTLIKQQHTGDMGEETWQRLC